MKRAIAAVSLAVAGLAVAAPAANASTSCTYRVVADTKIYENTQWDTNGGHWKTIMAGTTVAGPCGSSGGWTPITHVRHEGRWSPVASFVGDKDFMRTWTLNHL